ncbi:BOP1NT-domain-containing protein [Ascodesmis nigricans]|uniref:Ribosome biogenesis protein ERB1 n=1 Tax=Ascodesmis nigricans TaxID=341454 RepID=A0A4S2N875_9PEZI|nr:BOP1NT-domain-containing protein [Ascodesmis nigricans]
MPRPTSTLQRKRKLPTAPLPPAKSTVVPTADSDDEEFGNGLLDASFSDDSDSDADVEDQDEEDGEDEEDEENDETSDSDASADEFPELEDDEESAVDSDEIPSEGENNDDDGEVDASGRKIVLDSAGNPRYIYPEVNPVYDSDDSDREQKNTIGNIDLSLYDEYPHVGYDINGKKIMRPAKGKALDALLDQIDIPKGWTGMLDKNTGGDLKLTQKELEILRKIQMDEVAQDGYDPYAPTIEYFTSKTEVMPLSAAPEPKRRFIPSKHEQKRIMKIVRAIREGRIVPNKPKEPEQPKYYDIWADNAPERPDHVMHIPAPKLPPPTHDESYNPPEEYLPTEEEKKKWEDEDPEDREKDYLPRKHKALRLVPGYDKFINERFERCLDLYLAPRVRRNKLNIDPESLLPKLPSPQDLRPFPTTTATVYRGHEGRVRALSVDPNGIWLATGGDDGTVRVWEILTGREVWGLKLADEPVNSVKWRPVKETGILAAAAGDDLFLITPPIFSPQTEELSRQVLEHGFGAAAVTASTTTNGEPKKEPPAKWARPITTSHLAHVTVQITVRHTIKHIAWHRRGDYLATVSPEGQNRAVCIHHLPRHSSQLPFRKSKGIVQRVEFHPSRPILFVATQRYVRIYDLAASTLSKTLMPGARWISSFDVHPGGDNVIVGSYDKRLLWHDMELSTKPYRTLRYHEKAIRSVSYHKGGRPLFASASDDGTVQVFHGMVYADMLENPLLVPLKVLKGHKVTKALGVLDIEWHPKECWLFSAGADGTARLWN